MYPLVYLVVRTFAVFALCEADIRKVGTGEFIGQQFEHVTRAVFGNGCVLVCLANIIAEIMEF